MSGPAIDVVVKIGGGVLADVARFDAALDVIGEAARHRRILVVPGGGPFADAVRDVDGLGVLCQQCAFVRADNCEVKRIEVHADTQLFGCRQ